MDIDDIIIGELGIKLINGKIKPKYSLTSILGIIIMLVLFLVFVLSLVFGIINFNINFIIISIVGLFSFGYLLLISPYTQKTSNYYIEFKNENSLVGFKLYYKQKLINIEYIVDNDGRIAFANNTDKLSCISYADKTKMGNLTKYKIINYFAKWLSDNQLLSTQVTTTFEKL